MDDVPPTTIAPDPGPGASEAPELVDLNPAQRRAVQHGGGPLLILAGAGSGKTRTITRRIAHLIRARGLRPDQVLAITFTNKAAREMRERVAAMLPVAGSWIGTFHAMGARILRREIGLLEGWTSEFTIYDTDDRARLLKQVLKDCNLDTTHYPPGKVGAWISARKNDVGGARPASGQGSFAHDAFERVAQAYEGALRRNNALDFDDLLVKVLELFERHPGVRDLYARRFREVLVDEYQDTNAVQNRLLAHFASYHGAISVCGDPDQSIYAWRGADVGNILRFELDFPGAVVVRLEQNYRSRQNILSAAQAVIRHNRGRHDKDLWSERGPGERLCLLTCDDEDQEAREIAAQIQALVAHGNRLDQIAVFYRVNFLQRALERGLRLASIPYRVVAGTEFYQRREIKDLIAYLRLLVNPSDDEAFKRAVNVPQRGVGDKSLEGLAEVARARGESLARACRSGEARATVRGRARGGLEAFAALLERLEPLAGVGAAVALDLVIEETGYLEHLARSAEPDDVDREANVEELRSHARTYDETWPDGGLRGFLQDVALVSDVDGLAADAPKVTLMTLHAAKGLEFPHVFIVGLEEGLLPHARSVDEGWTQSGDNRGVEEERRLFYVGLTRARERLFLSHARVRRHFGGEQSCLPSRFLDELPRELLEGWDAEQDESDVLGEYAPAAVAAAALSVGDSVQHDHFGRGVVEQLVGAGANARATVRFEGHGSKQLLLQYARLRVLAAKGRR
jgi:DNA helicase-2/ATP-dependent DNA helicase PcrA